ncbi:Decaprenyl diphosphate synthase-like protein [Flagelloscypha sp. PMI_526]|nr:Decaprenyl diphosphate synthase-like protein [Flagelloscypha sp. PMI_526]
MFRALFFKATTWLHRKLISRAQRLVLRILAAGPVPRHVAFVMDGNRRYARRNHKQIAHGHYQGFLALRKALEICFRLNIRCVSVYAFAIDNFKRGEQEVDDLMHLAHKKLVEFAEHGELLDQYGVRLNVVGRKDLLPDFVQASVEKAEALTRKNNRSILNICMPYASRDEMTAAVQSAVRISLDEAADGAGPRPISEKDIDDQLYTTLAGSPPLDILVRTSGVKRLSDYLLWQCCEDTQLQFVDRFWPEFRTRDFIPIILDYQRKVWSRA